MVGRPKPCGGSATGAPEWTSRPVTVNVGTAMTRHVVPARRLAARTLLRTAISVGFTVLFLASAWRPPAAAADGPTAATAAARRDVVARLKARASPAGPVRPALCDRVAAVLDKLDPAGDDGRTLLTVARQAADG